MTFPPRRRVQTRPLAGYNDYNYDDNDDNVRKAFRARRDTRRTV
jgi:hypothetical protein